MYFLLRITSAARTVITTSKMAEIGYCDWPECPAPADNLVVIEGADVIPGMEEWACENHIAPTLLSWVTTDPE